MSQAEDLRGDILAACKILLELGFAEAYGHVSARLPEGDRFLITPQASFQLVLSPDDLITTDFQGRKLSGNGSLPLETNLHIAIYKHRPDVNAICRTHPIMTYVFGLLGKPIRPVHNFGSVMVGDVPIFERSELIETQELGDGAARSLGQSAAVILRGNGNAVVGKDVREACIRAIFMEESARMQYLSMQVGEPRYYPREEYMTRGLQALEFHNMDRAWQHYKRKFRV